MDHRGEAALKIVFVGNCQAHALSFLYQRHIGSKSGHSTVFVDAWSRHIAGWANEVIADAHIVLQQVSSGRNAFTVTPPSGARLILFPDVRGNFLWPFGNVERPDNPVTPFKPSGPYDREVGDAFLNKMVELGVSSDEALSRYLAIDVVGQTRLPRVFEHMIGMQRIRDAKTDISVADYIEAELPHRRLFRTQGHLDQPLFNHLAKQVYDALGANDSDIRYALSAEPSHPFEPFHDAPVHPAVIDFFGISYLNDNSLYYHAQEGKFTFSEYAVRYLANDWCPELHEACALVDGSDHERILALFDIALTKASGCGHGYERKANLLYHLSRYAEAAEAMTIALDREPGHLRYKSSVEHLRYLASHG